MAHVGDDVSDRRRPVPGRVYSTPNKFIVVFVVAVDDVRKETTMFLCFKNPKRTETRVRYDLRDHMFPDSWKLIVDA